MIWQNKKPSVLLYAGLFWWARVDVASRAAKNSLAGCFCPAGRKAPGRSCSHPPAYVSLTFAQKKTASVSLHQRFFHGRGWITQAAHLKRPRRGLFAAGTYSGGRCCSTPPLRRFANFQIKQKLQYPVRILEFLVGAGGFEPPKLKSSRFTVCPHWPLGNTPIFFLCPLPDDLLSLS